MDVLNITKITLAWELFQQGIPQLHIAQQLHVDRVTIYRWVSGVQKTGDLELFLDHYLSAKKGRRKKRKVDGLLKIRIWNLRDKYDCCGQKIRYFLNEEYGTDLGVTAIYEILKEKYKLRSTWKKNQKRGNTPHALKPQEVVQMDTVDFGDVYAFTGVDIFSKEVDILLAPALTAYFGYCFLKQAMERRFHSFVDTIQTDGGHEFKSDFQSHVLEYTNRHRVAHPYRKNEQSYIESFNRTLRKECLGWNSYTKRDIPVLTKEVEQYLVYYHEKRPHISLGMRPPLKVTTVAY